MEVLKILAMIRLEDELSKSMTEMGFAGQITFSDVTRAIRKDKDLMEKIEILNKKLKGIEGNRNG
jgi:hypothetical protein